jgi:hypothetical protein
MSIEFMGCGQFNREKFDCTIWSKVVFENMSIDELAQKADEYSKGL